VYLIVLQVDKLYGERDVKVSSSNLANYGIVHNAILVKAWIQSRYMNLTRYYTFQNIMKELKPSQNITALAKIDVIRLDVVHM